MSKGRNIVDIGGTRPGMAASTTNIKALPGAFKFKEITSQKLTDLTSQPFSKTNKTLWTRG
jgi:hypothetical protein